MCGGRTSARVSGMFIVRVFPQSVAVQLQCRVNPANALTAKTKTQKFNLHISVSDFRNYTVGRGASTSDTHADKESKRLFTTRCAEISICSELANGKFYCISSVSRRERPERGESETTEGCWSSIVVATRKLRVEKFLSPWVYELNDNFPFFPNICLNIWWQNIRGIVKPKK